MDLNLVSTPALWWITLLLTMIFNSPIVLILVLLFFAMYDRLKSNRLNLLVLFNFLFLFVIGIESFLISLTYFIFMNILFYLQKRFNNKKTLLLLIGASVVIFIYLKSFLNPSFSQTLFSTINNGSIGLSFILFAGVATLIEICRNPSLSINVKRTSSYLLFFPLVLAGPFVKPLILLEQLDNLGGSSLANKPEGFFLIGRGLFKKTISTFIHVMLINSNVAVGTAWETIAFSVALMIYLFADFSGYSDLACGLCALCGIRIEPNFNLPYLATSPTEFWRRWHISLNVWLRDYFYLPFCKTTIGFTKNRKSLIAIASKSYIILIMLLIGLWHSIRPLSLAYGAVAALPLVIGTDFKLSNLKFGLAISRILTLVYIVIIQVILVAPDFAFLEKYFKAWLNWNWTANSNFGSRICFLILCLILCQAFDWSECFLRLSKNRGLLIFTISLFILVFLIFGRNGGAFVYSNL